MAINYPSAALFPGNKQVWLPRTAGYPEMVALLTSAAQNSSQGSRPEIVHSGRNSAAPRQDQSINIAIDADDDLLVLAQQYPNEDPVVRKARLHSLRSEKGKQLSQEAR